jgi:hypothetical protein
MSTYTKKDIIKQIQSKVKAPQVAINKMLPDIIKNANQLPDNIKKAYIAPSKTAKSQSYFDMRSLSGRKNLFSLIDSMMGSEFDAFVSEEPKPVEPPKMVEKEKAPARVVQKKAIFRDDDDDDKPVEPPKARQPFATYSNGKEVPKKQHPVIYTTQQEILSRETANTLTQETMENLDVMVPDDIVVQEQSAMKDDFNENVVVEEQDVSELESLTSASEYKSTSGYYNHPGMTKLFEPYRPKTVSDIPINTVGALGYGRYNPYTGQFERNNTVLEQIRNSNQTMLDIDYNTPAGKQYLAAKMLQIEETLEAIKANKDAFKSFDYQRQQKAYAIEYEKRMNLETPQLVKTMQVLGVSQRS